MFRFADGEGTGGHVVKIKAAIMNWEWWNWKFIIFALFVDVDQIGYRSMHISPLFSSWRSDFSL